MASEPTAIPKSAIAQQLEMIERFDLFQRIQHILLITSFIMLALTGLPQSFASTGWARAWMGLFGGIDGVRKVHHLFAVVMATVFFYHVINVFADWISGRRPRAMLPRKKDLQDAAHAVKYLLDRTAEPPQYDRFDFRQKFEYWALIWGSVLMGATGIVMMFPEAVTLVFPGVVVYASKAAHGLEALLAVASIIVWHMYNTHWAQGMFPLDTTIFTGKISLERLKEEHPLEYQRLLEPEPEPKPVAEPEPARPRKKSPFHRKGKQ